MNSMSKYKEINLEEGMPTVDEAMSAMEPLAELLNKELTVN